MTTTATTAATATPATRNEAWGFWGSMGDQAGAAWPMAVEAISTATGESDEAARDFLDSCHGRHFADEVHSQQHAGADLAQAIEQATRRFAAWKISREAARQTGIPRGMSYLLGHVISVQLAADAAAV